ncbi:hypothetical protein Zmor_001442 [Zophobas morio]|uniref:Immunoglobulin V-set domain-containing protein n=1 Tax=Zophobas morio TaxID=2755281 RepID=A0AA38J1Q7_9CUCU|nr:hypothetical protein Zmor_001442 [Zophobas morio]
MRKRDLHILTSSIHTYTGDARFSVRHPEHSDDWDLRITYVQKRDAGVYECQVNTEPKINLAIMLNVEDASSLAATHPDPRSKGTFFIPVTHRTIAYDLLHTVSLFIHLKLNSLSLSLLSVVIRYVAISACNLLLFTHYLLRCIAMRRLMCVPIDEQLLLFAAVVTSYSSEVGPSRVEWKRQISVGVIETALRSMLQLFDKMCSFDCSND